VPGLADRIADRLPGPVASLLREAGSGDGREPAYSAPVDGAALRRAGALVPDGARYYVHHAPNASRLFVYNLRNGAQLLLLPARALLKPAGAQWILSYQAGTLLPPGFRAVRFHLLGDRIALVRVVPA
jgi:hypothetical protein